MKKILLTSFLIISTLLLVSCGKSNSVDIINPDAEYLYFFGATCPHCQELNRVAEEEDLFSKIAIEKREVYFNNTNRDMFLELVEEIKPDRDGVPFVYDTVTGQYAVGVEPALGLLKSRLDTPSEAQNTENLSENEVTETPSEIETMTGNIDEEETLSGPQASSTSTGAITE